MLNSIFSQFGHPRGFLGEVVGWIMAQNNQERNQWSVPLLGLRAQDRVLEIGFGPDWPSRKLPATFATDKSPGLTSRM